MTFFGTKIIAVTVKKEKLVVRLAASIVLDKDLLRRVVTVLWNEKPQMAWQPTGWSRLTNDALETLQP